MTAQEIINKLDARGAIRLLYARTDAENRSRIIRKAYRKSKKYDAIYTINIETVTEINGIKSQIIIYKIEVIEHRTPTTRRTITAYTWGDGKKDT